MQTIIDGIKDYIFKLWDTNPWALFFSVIVCFFFVVYGFKKLFKIGGKKKES